METHAVRAAVVLSRVDSDDHVGVCCQYGMIACRQRLLTTVVPSTGTETGLVVCGATGGRVALLLDVGGGRR